LNTTYEVTVAVSGSSISCYVNGGAPLITATDSQFTSGRFGMRTYNTAARFDDIEVMQ
jgi:hypothetical protein